LIPSHQGRGKRSEWGKGKRSERGRDSGGDTRGREKKGGVTRRVAGLTREAGTYAVVTGSGKDGGAHHAVVVTVL